MTALNVINILQGRVVTTNHVRCANYTVGHKKGATFIFTITLANVDRFQ